MPDTSELFGGFWDAAHPSVIIDAYAAAVSLLESAAVRQSTTPAVRVWTIRADAAVTVYADNGRAITGYPNPGFDPTWISTGLGVTAKVLAPNVDYVFDVSVGLITFDVDPLVYAQQYPVWVSGSPIAATDLWCGAPYEPQTEDSEAVTFSGLVAALAAACDSPATGSTVETVEAAFESDSGWSVITDRAAYRLGPADVPSATSGSVLQPGTPVGSAWTLTRLGPDTPALSYLTTPGTFHQGSADGGITWYNETVPLVIDTVSGRTRVRFRIGAASHGDADAFWTASHANGIATGGITLAQALDTRTNPVGDPDANSLPKTINPLELICGYLLGGNAWLSVIDTQKLGPGAMTASERSTLVVAAAGPYATVFIYEDAQPALTRYDPS